MNKLRIVANEPDLIRRGLKESQETTFSAKWTQYRKTLYMAKTFEGPVSEIVVYGDECVEL